MKTIDENIALEAVEKDVRADRPLVANDFEVVEKGPRKFTGGLVITSAGVLIPGGDVSKAEYQTLNRWAVCLSRDPEDLEGWITAEVIGLPGIASEGRTRDEAISNVREALMRAIEEGGAEEIKVEPGQHELPEGSQVVYVAV